MTDRLNRLTHSWPQTLFRFDGARKGIDLRTPHSSTIPGGYYFSLFTALIPGLQYEMGCALRPLRITRISRTAGDRVLGVPLGRPVVGTDGMCLT